MQVHEGGCLCGAVRFAVERAPERVSICHCRFCQRVTGGPYLVEPIFASEAFRVTKGTPRVHDTLSQGSGKVVHLHFCGGCGGRIALTFQRFAEVTGVYAGAFDDPCWFDIGPDNARHIFVGEARDDTVFPAGMPVFFAHATALDGTPRVATVPERHCRAGEIGFSEAE